MKRILIIGSLLTVFGLAVPSMWAITEFGIKQTSDVEFCGGCHSMEPMASSYLQDVHGGNNTAGIRATCSDCHLPHTSSFAYLKQKSINGAWDVWVEFVAGADDIDWHKKRERREEYTYQSGCLHCHEALHKATTTPATFVAHGPMLRGESNASCVSCHEHVGHYRLADALSNYTGATIKSE